MTLAQERHSARSVLRLLLAMAVGAALAFPGAAGWYVESTGYDMPWGLWLMVAVGGGGGLLWSTATQHRRKWVLRAAAVMLVLSPYLGLALYAAYVFARDRPTL